MPHSSCFRIFQDRGIVVPRLSSLDLSFNGLTEVPELLENIPDLRNLDISHNRVSRITGDEPGKINNLNRSQFAARWMGDTALKWWTGDYGDQQWTLKWSGEWLPALQDVLPCIEWAAWAAWWWSRLWCRRPGPWTSEATEAGVTDGAEATCLRSSEPELVGRPPAILASDFFSEQIWIPRMITVRPGHNFL